MLPVIALVGRPNVGKSRLFNRLVSGSSAIVEDTPGVTRDRNYGQCKWYGHSMTVIDTGGFEPDTEDVLLEQMRDQALLAVEEADIIIFVVDARAGCLPVDNTIATILRQSDKPIFIGANKLDTPTLAPNAAEFYSLGFEEVHPISAEHGFGIDEFMDALILNLPKDDPDKKRTAESAVRIAVIGKPNAGKSTLINRLLGSERLLTSDIPGTTRDSIDTLIERDGKQYVLIDTAGLRRKRSISLRLEKFSVVRAIKSIEEADIALILIDATQGATDQDAKIAHLAHHRGKSIALLLNKWDELKDKDTNTARDFEQSLRDKLPFCSYAPVVTISALTGQRTHKLLELVDRLVEKAKVRISTGDLNRTIEFIISQHQPPATQNKRIRFYYTTQVTASPPTFVLQVNIPEGIQTSYRRYMANKLREAYDFEGTPIRLLFRRPKGRHRWGEKK